MNGIEIFKKYEDVIDNEFLKFDNVKNKNSNRKDLHAFILLDKLFPGKEDILSFASHDEVTLSINYDQIKTLCEDDVIDLMRCGVIYESDYDCLKMFV